MQLMIMKAMDMDEIIWGQSREKKGQKPKRTLISNDHMKKEKLTNSTKKLTLREGGEEPTKLDMPLKIPNFHRKKLKISPSRK